MKGRRVLPVVLALCMVLGSLPGDLLGGVARVQAAAIEEDANDSEAGTVIGDDEQQPADEQTSADVQAPAEEQKPADVQTPAEEQKPADVQTPAEGQVPADGNGLEVTQQPEVQAVADVPVTVAEGDADTSGFVWDLSGLATELNVTPENKGNLDTTKTHQVGSFSIVPGSSSMTIEQLAADKAVSLDNGKEGLIYYLGLGGAGNKSKRAVAFTVSSSAKVTIWARKGGADDKHERKISFVDSTGTEIREFEPNESGDATLTALTVEVPAGTYSFFSKKSGINIFDIQIESNLDMAKALKDVEPVSKTKEDFTAGDFNFIAGNAEISVLDISADDKKVSSDDGQEFTKAFDLGGVGNKAKRAIKFSLDVSTTLNIYALSGSTDERPLIIENEAGEEQARITAKAKANFVNAAEVALPAGTYYAYSGLKGIAVYNICVKSEEPEKTPWADVPTPVITNVSTDSDGNVVVDFEASIDKYTGAEEVRIIMFEDGYEFSSVTVSSQKTTSVTFVPLRSGDYTFKAIATRSGEADKVSAEAALNGYVLPVKKPIVELIQNRGNGSVYLDWINVEAADHFNVYYKESGAAAYTEAAKDLTDGHFTVSGLTAGSTYDFKIDAVRTSDNFIATYEKKNFAVTADREDKWYFGTVGSAQKTDAEVYNADGSSAQSVHMKTDDASVTAGTHAGIKAAEVDIVNTDKYITFKASGDGKISDGEEGFQYFYTMLDPNRDNFELTATFELTESSEYDKDGNAIFDNQTGYGIIVTDMLGYNYYETEGLWIKHKQFNSVSTQAFRNKGFVGQRNISGYVSCDTTSVEGVTRETYQTAFKNTPSPGNFNIGDKFTFTLKKTNDAYISICNGEEIVWDNLAITSVQEDGSICVGVFTSRKAGVKITDIQFTCTDDSTGVKVVEKTDEVSPSVAILSSNTTNTSSYEYIYHPNVAGQLTVKATDGTVVYDEAVAAYDVVKVPVPVVIGDNTITSSLVPDKSQSLTSYDTITKTTKVSYQRLRNGIGNLYVSPEGSADGDGTSSNPLDVATAVKYVAPGQKIILLNGTYTGGASIGRSVSGTADKHIVMAAEEAGKVIFEGAGISLVGSYWDIYGIYVHYPTAVGIQICGNYNTVEMCTVEGSQNTGIQISRSGSVDREPALKSLLWPSYNLVKNCESFDNCDSGRNDADGFAAKLTCGEGNVFYGCIAHNNIDDGWDLFAKAISGEIGQVTIENCVAYNNGWLTYEGPSNHGEGNGFKLGGNDMYGGHVLKNSVSFGNIAKGITSNSCPDCKVYNSTSYGNAQDADYAFQFATKTSNKQQWVVQGLISATTTAKQADYIPYSFHTEDNYFFDGTTSHNNQGVEVSDDWFESVDLSIVPTRNEDGTINMHGLLVLTANAPADAGARLDTTSDEAKSVNPLGEVPKDDNEIFDDDNNDDNNGDDNNSGDSNSDDGNDNGGSAEEVIADVDWDAVANNIDAAAKSKAPKNIDVASGDRYEVPVKVLNKLKGKNTTLALHAGGGITLSITGTDIKKDATAPFKVAMSHGNVIPAGAANQVLAGATANRMFSMEDKSVYPFPVNVHVNLGASNAGKTAYMYYYDEKSNSMVLAGSFRITATGQAMFALYRGDEYIIVVSDKAAAVKGKYIVVKGDNLTYIAKKTGVALKKLIGANPQIKNVNRIVPGQEINLP